jgi:hypothetical protein
MLLHVLRMGQRLKYQKMVAWLASQASASPAGTRGMTQRLRLTQACLSQFFALEQTFVHDVREGLGEDPL